ncbi:MAG: protein translocase subunit SecF [Candidatus Magasanikbacteria bacterium]|jgi:preprotein translocase subunit SecF|nr:protein translocase subunit SecF [Candidatus Magasanikbacteria bacterium]MBT4221032.1 protein translocase subunit SecF [Candidatus Magasanikbacteria bacterium]MBT4350624.1 protein translocase subunit SecF [Candidatus Magasanikbacteria bacterium]MBT4542077.1 protein translocase subunit SecF [Candidatus Magasanikbacteria bacterium]MBT6253563.1 protein translocase subunit SecF [Candidatus Magasanikbacteria bacterium]
MLQIIKRRNISFTFSAILFVGSLVLIGIFGLKPGVDFTGGSLFEFSFSENRPSIEEVKEVVNSIETELGSFSVQPVDEDSHLIKTRFTTEDEHQEILTAVRLAFETDSQRVLEERVETIGPAISSQLRRQSIGIAIAVMIAIVLYVGYAFRKVSRPVKSWKYGITAIIALVHDVVIVMGVYAVLGYVAGVEVDIPFVVALLTILGYSVNDTIVVFDRVRENLLTQSGRFEDSVNQGVNDSLTRSINTSVTTLIVLLALFLFGAVSVKYFSLALIIGIIAGTYSSIFLASPLLIVWKNWGERKK